MTNDILKSNIEKYNPINNNELKSAFKETLQNIILCELAKTDFFLHAVFYGGTSLRILRGLNRFSEDLDFSLIDDTKFSFISYIKQVTNNMKNYGINCTCVEKEKRIESSVETYFFDFTLKELVALSYPEKTNSVIFNEKITIKIELEHNYIEGGDFETKLIMVPSFAQIRTYSIETLFACKLLAILNRKWKSRIKGRDYYDYLFYISKGVSINLSFLENGLRRFGLYNENREYTINDLKKDLYKKFNEVNFIEAKKDVISFIKENDLFINSFNSEIFISTIESLKKQAN